MGKYLVYEREEITFSPLLSEKTIFIFIDLGEKHVSRDIKFFKNIYLIRKNMVHQNTKLV